MPAGADPKTRMAPAGMRTAAMAHSPPRRNLGSYSMRPQGEAARYIPLPKSVHEPVHGLSLAGA
jgi:hypothetical protein